MTLQYGDKVTGMSKDLTPGYLVRILKMVNIGNVTNELQPYGLSPMSNRPLVGRGVGTVMGFEGGTGISVTNATEKYGKKGTLLKRALRIDKRPWINGQTDMRLRITVTHGHTIGLHGFGAPDKVYIRQWRRNEPFEETFASGTAPTDEFLESHGFGESSASIHVKLEPRDANPEAGHPLVWDSENGLSETYTGCFWSDPSFSHGYTYIAMLGGPPYILYFPIDNPTWTKHHLNFSNGFVAVKYNGTDPLGVVQGVGATIEAIGWDTGFHDLEGWHEGPPDDEYQIPKPNSYEYPNYPISDPFNPTGEGVG